MSTDPAVEITGLVKNYGRTAAVAGLSLRAERCQVTAILGPNGAGKTTTIEICGPTPAPSACSASIRPATPASCGPGSA